MKTILSVYITSEEIRILEATRLGKLLTVRNAFCITTPAGSVEDGVILEPGIVAGAIREGLEQHQIKTVNAGLSFVVASKKIASKEMVLPYVANEKKLHDMIFANLMDYFPMNNMEDYRYRYQILNKFTVEERRKYSVLVFAMPRQLLNGYQQLADDLHISMETIDCYNNSLYQLLKRRNYQGCVLALQVDNLMTTVTIMKGANLLFSRPISYGKDTLIQNLADLKGITDEKAERLLADSEKLTKELRVEELPRLIIDLADAVSRVVEFQAGRNPETTIEQCKICGTLAHITGVTQFLSTRLGVEVEADRQLPNVRIDKKKPELLLEEVAANYFPNIGVCMESLDFQVEKENVVEKKQQLLFYGALTAALLLNLSAAVFLQNRLNVLQERQEALTREISVLEGAQTIYDMYVQAQQDWESAAAYYDATEDNNEALGAFIADLEKMMPEGTGLVSLTAAKGYVTLDGTCQSKEALSLLTAELKKTAYISEVTVQRMSDTYDEFNHITTSFQLNLQLHWEGRSEE